MKIFDAKLDVEAGRKALGLIVLQADETLEPEIATAAPDLSASLYVSRIPSAAEVSTESLSAMRGEIARAAALLPPLTYAAVGYACTSASAVIGSAPVAELIQGEVDTLAVTNPLSAAVARAVDLGVRRLAVVSPYVEEVNVPLLRAFAREGLEIAAFGSFGIAEEHDVARISTASVIDAALEIGSEQNADAVFLSCTNLRTLAAIPEIESRLKKPVLSSNSALLWHLRHLKAMSKSSHIVSN